MAYQETPAARLRALRQRWEADRTSRVFLQLAEEYRRQGSPAEALPVLEEGLRHHPTSIAGQVALGRCRLELGQAEGAAAILEKVVERDPTQMVAYRTLVDAYVKLGASGEARDRLSHYAQLNPQDPEIEVLGSQIAVLSERDVEQERAQPSSSSPAEAPAPPEDESATLESREESDRELPSSGAREDAEAAPPTSVTAELAGRGTWPVTVVEPAWVSTPPVPPSGSAPTGGSREHAPTTPPPLPASAATDRGEDTPTAILSLQDVAQPLASPPAFPAPPALPEEHPADDRLSSLATVQFDLAEIKPLLGREPALAAEASELQQDRAEPTFESAAATTETELGESSGTTGFWGELPDELSSDGEDDAIGPPAEGIAAEPWMSDDGMEAPDDDTPAPPARRSWSIGESEIVFSLPPVPLLRDRDLAAIPRRPLALPLWVRQRSGFGTETPAAKASTPTLAQLYLDQGHPEEAAELFEQVLEREPSNELARAGLERVHQERARLTAQGLLGDLDTTEVGLSAKQAHVLRRWASLLREAHRRDAS